VTPTVDRLWPDPVAGLPLDAAFIEPPRQDLDRPWVATNMVTSVDGRAQLEGTAEGLGSRTDRRLMQAYRAGFDAVGSGAGTLRADDFYSRLADDLADARAAAGRPPQPLALVIAGSTPVPPDRRWFEYDQQRIVVVGHGSPHASDGRLPGAQTWVAPTDEPEPAWILERLAAAGVGSLLLEGGPTLNAAFLAAGLLDEVYWTIGPHLVGAEALPMVAPIDLSAPVEARLVSVHRHADELYLRYRIGASSIGP
jgi:riboflavin biosynthesis pyrimidine reductase